MTKEFILTAAQTEGAQSTPICEPCACRRQAPPTTSQTAGVGVKRLTTPRLRLNVNSPLFCSGDLLRWREMLNSPLFCSGDLLRWREMLPDLATSVGLQRQRAVVL